MNIKVLRPFLGHKPGEVIEVEDRLGHGLCVFGDAVMVAVVPSVNVTIEARGEVTPQQVEDRVREYMRKADPISPAPGHPAHKRETPTRRPQETRKTKAKAKAKRR